MPPVCQFLFGPVCDTKSVNCWRLSPRMTRRCYVKTRLFRDIGLFLIGGFFLLGATAIPTRRLILAVATEPSTLDGQAVIDRNSRVASGNIFESLLDRDRSGQIVPWLAES